MRKILLFALVFVTSLTVFGQDFSNKGKEFWLAYSYHVGMVNAAGGAPAMTIYLTSDITTTYTVEIYGVTTISTGTINANQVIPVVIPNSYFINADGLFNNRTIHVTALQPIVVYSFITRSQASAASLCLPTSVLGKEYYASSFTQISNEANSCSYITIIAVQDNTSVEITVTAATRGGWLAGSTNTVNLNKGQVYQVLGNTTGNNGVDLAGSRIKSISSGMGGCNPIAVFSGSGKISIGAPAVPPAPACSGGSADNLYQQLYPVTSWGKKFLTAPSAGRPYNHYRVMRSKTTTNLYVNGILISPLSFINDYYQFFNNTPNSIEADEPISVAQYFTSQNCPNGSAPGGGNPSPYDPDMVLLNPLEQSIDNVTLVSSPLTITPVTSHQHHLQIIMKTGGTSQSNFKIDNVLVPVGSWITHPQNPAYSYLYRSGTSTFAGNHTISSDSGFNAIAYGYGNAETYAYSAGANVRDLTKELELETTYGIETSPSICTNAPFKFRFYIPDSTLGTPPVAIRFDSLRWDISDPSLIVPNNFPIMVYPPCGPPCTVTYDSITIKNGKRVTWYSLPTTYYFNAAGIDTLLVTGYTSTNEGCGVNKLYDFRIVISDPPTASFTATAPGCYTEPVVATETTPQFPKTTYRQWWEFFDPVTNVTTVYTNAPPNPATPIRTISHTFTTPGVKRIRHASITTPGCLSDTIVQNITLADIPNATIAGNTAVCINSVPSVPVTFTGSLGTAEYIFSYNINGGATLTTPASTGGIYTINAPTNVAGAFTYNLVGVSNALPVGTPCTRVITGQSTLITINPLPTASITGTINVCQNAPSPNITFTGAAGTAPYTFTYNINGGANQTITTVAGNSVTIPAPTNVVGTFSYNLVSVLDASSTLCSQAQSGSAVVTVNPLPTAAVTGTTSVCKNAASPLITFTGAAGTAPYTFTYNINGGANQTITTVAGNSVTIAAPTNVVGTFNYNLVSVLDASSTLCTQAQTGSAVITVNDLPTASIAGTITVCLNAPSPDITFTGANTTAPYTFSYTINGGPVQTVTTVAGNSVTVPVPTNVAGTFTYDLVSVLDGSTTLCTQAQTGSAVVIVKPLPTASIAGNTTVCRNAASPLITFTGAVGTAPYTFTYNINGGANQTVTTVAGNSVTVAAPTNVAGTFTYNLVSVQEGSANTCSQAQPASVVVIVNDLPTASISGTTEVCLNTASPLVTFTGASTLAPYTFIYKINGGPNQTVTTVAGNSVTVSVPTNVAGTFTYALVSVQDGSSTTCIQAQSGSAVITVHPLPTANFNYAAPSCATRTVSFTDASVPNVGTLTGWAWNFGDPGSGANNASALQNPTHTFATAGPYTVTLIATSSKGCSNLPFTRTVTIDNRPEAGFIIPEVCLSDTYAQFTDTSKLANAVINRWDWNFGDPGSGPLNVSNLQHPTHSYTAVGTYNVRLIVWNFAKDCRDTITQVLQVNGSFPNAIFSVNNPTTLCANDSVAVVEASTVFPGTITKIEIWFDNVASGPPVNPPNIVDNSPFTGKVYRHLYPNFQAPLTKVFQIRYRAYSGGVCLDDSIRNITVNAAPRVQFNNIPNTCWRVNPFQLTVPGNGGVPGSGIFSGPGISPTGIFDPQVAGIGTHTILYTYTSSAGGCVDTMSKTITVLDTAHATFSYVLPACEQTPVSFTDLSTAPASVTLANTVWDFNDGTPIENHPPGSTFTHVFALPLTRNVMMYNVSTVGCLSTDTIAPVNIDPNHTISLNAGGNPNQTVCVNTPITPIIYTLGGGATGATVTGLPAGITATVTGNTLTISGTPTTTVSSPYSFNIITTGNTCVTATSAGIITVDPDHAISLNGGSNDNQTLCINTPIAPIVYTISGGANGATVTGLPPGVTATVTGNTLTISGTPTATVLSPYNFNISTTGNSCIVATASGTINVLADHSISLNAGSNNNQTVCINTPITDIVYTIGGGATGATVTGLPAGINATVAGNQLTISGVPTTTVASPFTFSVITTGNVCVLANAAGSITVLPDHAISHIVTSGDTAQSVCVNTAIDPIVYDLGGGATTATALGLPPGVTGVVTAGNTFTISGTPTSSAGSPYNFAIQTGGNACVIANTLGEIKVNPYPVPDFTFDKTSYCVPNANVGFINTTTPTPLSNYTYLWDFGDGFTSTALSPTHLYTSAQPSFTVKLKARSTVLLNGGIIGCESENTKFLTIVHPQPKADFAKNKPSVCIGDVVTFTDDTRGGGLIQKSFWDMGDGTPIQNNNPLTYLYRDTLPSPFIITYYSQDTWGCNSDTIKKPFTVYPYPVVDAGPDKSVLEGGSVQLEATVFARSPDYSWTPVQYLTDSKILRPRVVNPATDMTYRLTVTALGGCQRSNDVFVKLLKFPVIANTFSPNGDGINDKWRIDFLNTYPDNRVQIFTRAGKIVFESRGYSTPWDGTLKGKPLPFDTYYYIIEPGNGRDPITGYVTILK